MAEAKYLLVARKAVNASPPRQRPHGLTPILCDCEAHSSMAIPVGQPADPVVRFSVKMGDSEDENEIVLSDVNDPVGETPNRASSRILIKDLPRPRELLDAVYREEHLPEKLVPKAVTLAVVIVDRVVKLRLRDMKEADSHLARYSARTSSADTVAASPDL